MSATEKDLVGKRGRAKAAITRTLRYIESTSNFDASELKIRSESLNLSFNDFQKLDEQLSEELSEIATVEEDYFKAKSLLENALSGCQKTNQQTTSTVEVILQQLADQQKTLTDLFNPQTTRSKEGYLPAINIPTFSGNYIEWNSFKDLYTSSVHENEVLTDIQKFHYLKGLLKVSESTYKEAFDKLVERFDRKKIIVSSLVKTFMEQPAVSAADEKSLRNIADTADEVLRSLRAISEEATSRDPWLIHILLEKVDPETRLQWSQTSSATDFPTTDQFLTFLNSRCSALEVYNAEASNKGSGPPSNTTRPAAARSNTQQSQQKCPLCFATHPLYRCERFNAYSVRDKRNFIRKKQLCFNCFSSHHKWPGCPSSFRCQICKQKHHTAIHEDLVNNVATSYSPPCPPPPPPPDSPPEHATTPAASLQRACRPLSILTPLCFRLPRCSPRIQLATRKPFVCFLTRDLSAHSYPSHVYKYWGSKEKMPDLL
ncbi:hypothetical protein JTE90_023808 [Oedothorax gibbosus]|uniref:Gag protein n=1 Tax=Oedothorax gibbosus TaxID=931172 RepID=A0AAV6VIA0_9ARAC|nr:hypothetical protein JTE90_023808 [Oedothorax gibbosus]